MPLNWTHNKAYKTGVYRTIHPHSEALLDFLEFNKSDRLNLRLIEGGGIEGPDYREVRTEDNLFHLKIYQENGKAVEKWVKVEKKSGLTPNSISIVQKNGDEIKYLLDKGTSAT